MITAAILWLIWGFVTVAISPFMLLPDVSLSSGFGAAISTAGQYLSPFNTIIPVDTMIYMVGIFIAYETGYGIYKITMWVIRRIPTQS